MSLASKRALGAPRSAARARACATMAGLSSMPTASPGATAAARPRVMVPGPHPASSRRIPGRRWGSRKAASRSAVRAAMAATGAVP
jgi:hypothetical protein